MGDRPCPVILPGGDLVIPGDPGAIGALILALRAFRPAAPRIRAQASAILSAAEEALALIHARAASQQAAARPAPTPAVVAPAQPRPASDALMIGTAEAQDLTGLSAERWRQLAVSGRIRGRQVHRRAWELSRDDVLDYDRQRRHRGAGSGKAPRRGEGEAPGTGSAAAA